MLNSLQINTIDCSHIIGSDDINHSNSDFGLSPGLIRLAGVCSIHIKTTILPIISIGYEWYGKMEEHPY